MLLLALHTLETPQIAHRARWGAVKEVKHNLFPLILLGPGFADAYVMSYSNNINDTCYHGCIIDAYMQ